MGVVIGKAFDVPGSTQFWELAAQPIATVCAGLGAVGAGALAYWNGQLSRKQEQGIYTADVVRERESALRTRYLAVAEQLANESSAIRLAGVYSVAALADDWHTFGDDSERRVCIDLLRAYLRVATEKLHTPDGVALRSEESGEREVRQTIVRLISDRVHTPADPARKRWPIEECSLARSFLRHVRLEDADLSGMDFDYADLTGADLAGANLSDAHLYRATLTGDADLQNSNLTNTHLERADLTSAKLGGATLEGTKFDHTVLTAADFSGTELHRVSLTGAVMKGTNMFLAELTDTSLTDEQWDVIEASQTILVVDYEPE